MPQETFVIVGAGILGAAIAREVTLRYPHAAVRVVEKEPRPAAHQTGHNSGVVHAGLYYEPGSLKAALCRRGGGLLQQFCIEHGIAYEECGKIVVALDDAEENRLRAIFDRAVANGVPDVELIGPERIREIEPHAVGRRALYSPHTAIVDYPGVTRALIAEVETAGGIVSLRTEVLGIHSHRSHVTVETTGGDVDATQVIVCGGLQADRLARTSGNSVGPSVIPFFGQYSTLDPAHRDLVGGLIYPVPDPAYPFLGVHITPHVSGETLIGPNAFLSLGRENYSGWDIDVRDCMDIAVDPGFWRFAAQNYPAAFREIGAVISRRQFLRGATAYVPALEDAESTPYPRGIRAQAMNADGSLVDDFVIDHTGRTTVVRNAPSPAATSALAIAEHVVATHAEANGL